MSNQDKLNLYIRQVHQRLRLDVRCVVWPYSLATALITTVFLALILNVFAFPVRGLTGARSLLLVVLGLAAAFGLASHVALTRARAAAAAEAAYPEFQQRLLTFDDAGANGRAILSSNCWRPTRSPTPETLPPATLVPDNHLYLLAGAGLACLAVLVWMIAAGPGYLGYGASLLWTGPRRTCRPFMTFVVTPGRRGRAPQQRQMVTAQVIGLQPDKVSLFARYQSARGGSRLPCSRSGCGRLPTYQFLFAGLAGRRRILRGGRAADFAALQGPRRRSASVKADAGHLSLSRSGRE